MRTYILNSMNDLVPAQTFQSSHASNKGYSVVRGANCLIQAKFDQSVRHIELWCRLLLLLLGSRFDRFLTSSVVFVCMRLVVMRFRRTREGRFEPFLPCTIDRRVEDCVSDE